MKRVKCNDTMDTIQDREVVFVVKTTIAAKLTSILESWDSLTKEDLRGRITLIRDELAKNKSTTDDFPTEQFDTAETCPNMKQANMKVMDEIVYREVAHAMKTAKTKIARCKLSGCGGVDHDASGAVALLEERVKDKDSEAMWMLGLCCEYGMGIEQDIERAEFLYRNSYEEGNVVGEFLKTCGKNGRGRRVMRLNGLRNE